MQRVAEVYGTLIDFRCRIVTKIIAEYSGNESFIADGSAELQFRRGYGLMLSGETRGGPVPRVAYGLRLDRSGVVSVRVDVPGMEAWGHREDMRDAIYELSGATSRAPVLACSLLLGLQWRGESPWFPRGDLITAMSDTVKHVRTEKVDGTDCYVVSASYASSVPTELWVRVSDYMVVRCEETWSGKETGSRYAMTRKVYQHRFEDIFHKQ